MSRRRILLASRNPDKLSEIRDLLAVVPIDIMSPDELGIAEDPAEAGVECWDGFAANALAKASWFRARSGLPTIADDSGLCVDALNGGPGVHSRRFAPVDMIDDDGQHAANNRHLLTLLEGMPEKERGAYFCCALALLDDRFRVVTIGRVEGTIATAERGTGGFGYDPLFVVPEFGRTFGELSADVKAELSHRARAVQAMRSWLG
ncbi:MAG: non-canonical purine NTP pyrophosphatase [Gemmatimonadales bacterium]|nr:MAG: non-canonical purine NTP pyrophosphatase [Gemmatimonadales bacterium]